MIIKELRSYDTPKLKSMVIKLKTSLMENRFRMAQGEFTTTSDMKKSRKVIAQCLTILRERNERLTPKDWHAFGKVEEEDKK